MERRLGDWRSGIVLLAIPVAMGISQALMGRVVWCEAGDLWPWSWDVWSRHNSQHLIDPYALSHIEHGIGLFLLLTLVAGSWLSVHGRTLIVAGIEGLWEVAENTPAMIERYREATISLDYFGDSILNSLGDYGLCLLGVLLARSVRWQASALVLVALEIVSILWIRDSLLLNIVMLTVPIEAIRIWQAGQVSPAG